MATTVTATTWADPRDWAEVAILRKSYHSHRGEGIQASLVSFTMIIQRAPNSTGLTSRTKLRPTRTLHTQSLLECKSRSISEKPFAFWVQSQS